MIPIACENCGHVGQYSLKPIVVSEASAAHTEPEPIAASMPSASRTKGQLSDREKDVTRLIVSGLRNKEIAEKLFISEQTVKNHLNHIFVKTGVKDRLELALWMISRSATAPDSQASPDAEKSANLKSKE